MRKSASKSVFKADKVSGAEATVFMLSPVLEVIYNSNFLYKFNFPFYALSWDKNIYHTDEWIDENRYEAAALALLRNGQKNGFAQFLKIEAKIKKEVLNFRRYGLEVSEQLADCSNEELVRHYNEFMDEYVRIFGLGAITFLYESTLSEKLSKSIAGRYANATEIISQLVQTKYTSFMIAAEADLVKIKNTKTARDRKKLMQQFLKRFYFIRASYAYSPSLEARYVAADAKKARLAARRRTPVAATLTRQEKAIITLLKITEVIRDQRKIASLVGPYVMSRFIDEAVTRLRVSRGDIDRMFWFEYGELVSEPHALLKK